MLQATQTKKLTQLEQKVISINTLYEYAKKCIEEEKTFLSQFIGKDVFKQDGSFLKKYEHRKPSFEGRLDDGTFFNVHCYIECKYNSVRLQVRSCVNGGSHDDKTAFCIYDSLNSHLFDYIDNKLVATNTDTDYLNTRYSANELKELEKEIIEAAKVYDKIYSKMPYVFKEVTWIERLTR